MRATGATEISAARRQVLSAVNAARATGFEVADDLSLSYVDERIVHGDSRRPACAGRIPRTGHLAASRESGCDRS